MQASTKVSKRIQAPCGMVYQAFLDPNTLALWRAPDNMKGRIHEFEARVGGRYRMSLTYTRPEDCAGGKTSGDTDTFRGEFAELVPCEKIVELIEFESQEEKFKGTMKMTSTFIDRGTATDVTILCEDIPPGIRREDNELGSRLSLKSLARLVER